MVYMYTHLSLNYALNSLNRYVDECSNKSIINQSNAFFLNNNEIS